MGDMQDAYAVSVGRPTEKFMVRRIFKLYLNMDGR
jgi:hypothetical protein